MIPGQGFTVFVIFQFLKFLQTGEIEQDLFGTFNVGGPAGGPFGPSFDTVLYWDVF